MTAPNGEGVAAVLEVDNQIHGVIFVVLARGPRPQLPLRSLVREHIGLSALKAAAMST
jgi:hypothetical protein